MSSSLSRGARRGDGDASLSRTAARSAAGFGTAGLDPPAPGRVSRASFAAVTFRARVGRPGRRSAACRGWRPSLRLGPQDRLRPGPRPVRPQTSASRLVRNGPAARRCDGVCARWRVLHHRRRSRGSGASRSACGEGGACNAARRLRWLQPDRGGGGGAGADRVAVPTPHPARRRNQALPRLQSVDCARHRPRHPSRLDQAYARPARAPSKRRGPCTSRIQRLRPGSGGAALRERRHIPPVPGRGGVVGRGQLLAQRGAQRSLQARRARGADRPSAAIVRRPSPPGSPHSAAVSAAQLVANGLQPQFWASRAAVAAAGVAQCCGRFPPGPSAVRGR